MNQAGLPVRQDALPNVEQPAPKEAAFDAAETHFELPVWSRDIKPTDTAFELPAFVIATQAMDQIDAEAAHATQGAEQLAQQVELPDDLAQEVHSNLGDTLSDFQAIQVELLQDLGAEMDVDLLDQSIDEEMAPHFFDIEDKANDPELREEVVQQGLQTMREVLNGIDDYVVFASTAMYLQGNAKGIEEFKEPPGDFDAVVDNAETLRRIQERLQNVPGITFSRGGKWKRLAGGAEVLSGEIKMQVKGKDGQMLDTAYPFEFFNDTFIVNDEVKRHREKVGGLNALSIEGLQIQYTNNLAFESKVGANARQVTDFLNEPSVKRRMLEVVKGDYSDPLNRAIYDKLGLGPDQINEFYAREQNKPDPDATDAELQSYQSEMAILLAGFKTKIPKREKNVAQLRNARTMNVGTETTMPT